MAAPRAASTGMPIRNPEVAARSPGQAFQQSARRRLRDTAWRLVPSSFHYSRWQKKDGYRWPGG
jgi:hypothetical protein